MKRFIFLLLFLGCLDAYSQKVAIRVNALSAIDGAFGGGISYAIGNKNTVELTGSLRPWKRSEEYVNRYWLLQPEYKYWTCQKYNGFGGLSERRTIQHRRQETAFRRILPTETSSVRRLAGRRRYQLWISLDAERPLEHRNKCGSRIRIYPLPAIQLRR